ncbi:trimethylguanosine synthase [Trichogramma pretiosum]|uniref:Trimethylguanosine synthase n=1 Tax=Trichogramma kaykai TaxID=54128 RepID=A0ABD2X9B7_9HYME|nr:trimethylguanosine synthase [Trichogramma pretiosum]
MENKSKRKCQPSAFQYCTAKFQKVDMDSVILKLPECQEKSLEAYEEIKEDLEEGVIDDLEEKKRQKIQKKFWIKRYQLFSKFDQGIKLDYESWFSVTPEKIARHIAERCKCKIIIDAFAGAGGNTINFAQTCDRVIAIDIDPKKIDLARNNAKIYGVEHKIEFLIGDFFELAPMLKADVVFLSPPWGGPSYINKSILNLENIMSPYGGEKLLEQARKITKEIAYYLPKNINKQQLAIAAGPNCKVEIESNYLDDKIIAKTAYYGNLLRV